MSLLPIIITIGLGLSMLFIGKRLIFGPQKIFIRFSVLLVVMGIATLQVSAHSEDLAAHVAAGFVMIGLLLALAMISLDCLYMARKLFKNRNEKNT